MLNIEEKEDLFLSEILNQRKQSANLITSKYKQIHSSKLIIKKFLFLKYLLSKRKKAQEKLIATIKGYLVHKKVSSYLSKVKTSFIITTEIEGYENLKMKVYFGKKEKIFDVIKETFINANEKLVSNEEINSLFSGSTCVSVIYTPEKLIVPNIGDSRAVLGRLINKETNEYKAIELSRDHKPTEKDEEKRILENDGRIQPFIEDGEFVGPQRVWIKEDEVPGLAMTRSFGDRMAATVGVISEPEIKEYIFNPNDKFMIIASDGIWEFISSQECINIIKEFYNNNDIKGFF